jgi:glycosyltransferase involved in cell wall biosynthesis
MSLTVNNQKVSIIIPVYNSENYIKQCINSIITQSYKELEVIVVDDGSTDRSADICDQLSAFDSRIKVFHRSNEGAASARNFGLYKATGNWVIFVDSDDFWRDHTGLNDLMIFSESINYPFDFIIFNYTRYFQKDNIFVDRPDFPYSLASEQPKQDKVKLLMNNKFIPAPPWGKLIRTGFLKRNEINFINKRSSEDIPWFINLLEKAVNFSVTNLRFHVYRKQVPGALTNSFSPSKYENLFDIVKSESSRLRDINSKDPLRNLLLSFMAYEYAILLSTSANFRGRDFLLKYKELAELEWLLEYDNARAVRKIKILKRFVPNIFIPMILHIYAKYYVNKL